MAKYNIQPTKSIEEMYSLGFLPQRNDKNFFYFDTSCRSNLKNFSLSSENRRILKKVKNYTHRSEALSLDFLDKKLIYQWNKKNGWNFPMSSIKYIFSKHIFNYIDIWYDQECPVAFLISLKTKTFSHAAYLFYNPEYHNLGLTVGVVLQFVIDSHEHGLDYTYLGRFSKVNGYYKRNMPGFEFYNNGQWSTDLSLL